MNILNHGPILGDRIRTAKYREALLKQIKPGDKVCDLGCGSGIMGFLALQAGASHIYAIENEKVIETAKALAFINGFEEQMTFYHANSFDVKLPEKVDWIIMEWMSPLGLDEFPLGNFIDARKRFLSPESKGCIPRRVDHMVTAVEDGLAWKHAAEPWYETYFNLKLDSVLPQALDRSFDLRVQPEGLLGREAKWLTVDLANGDSFPSHGNFSGDRVTVIVERKGICHGLAAWFDADLGEQVHLSNHPALPKTHWDNIFVPLPVPVPVEIGDKISIDISRIRTLGRDRIAWSMEIERGGKVIGSFDNKKKDSDNDEVEQVVYQKGHFIPSLNSELQRFYTFLSYVDGKRDAREIACSLAIERPDLFATFETAIKWIVDKWSYYK